MSTTRRGDDELAAELAAYDEHVKTVDSMLTLIANVRREKVRDPLRRLEDVLLELRLVP